MIESSDRARAPARVPRWRSGSDHRRTLVMWKCTKCGQKVDDAYEICWACGTTVDGVENPHFLDEVNWSKEKPAGPDGDVAPESLVTLTKCSLPPQAHAIRVRLESEGIPVFLFD